MGSVFLDVNGVSYHTNPVESPGYSGTIIYQDGSNHPYSYGEKRYNESNPGVGIRYEWGQGPVLDFVMLGEYLNSINKQTNYAGIGSKYRLFGDDNGLNGSLGIALGAMTGYGKGVTTAVLPMAQVGYGPALLNLMYAPKTSDSPETYMLNASYRIK